MKSLMYIVALGIGGFGLWILFKSIPALLSAISSTEAIGGIATTIDSIFSIVGAALVIFAGLVFVTGNIGNRGR